jgi:hypothetical protein
MNTRDKKTFILFDSTYEDDAQVDSNGGIVEPRGRNILLAYAKWLETRCDRVDIVDQHEEYGWSIQFKVNVGSGR